MVFLSDVLRVTGTTHNAVNYWRKRGYLKTKLAKTTPGVAREISRANALEIGFMSALTSMRMHPSKAATVVASWMKAEREGTLLQKPINIWRQGATSTLALSTEHFRESFPYVPGSALTEQGSDQDRA